MSKWLDIWAISYGDFARFRFDIQYIPRNMHTVFALLCFVVVIHWLIFPYPSGLLRWHCGNLTIAPVPARQPWWIWINTSCEIIMNDYITTTKQSTTKPCAYLLGYTVSLGRISSIAQPHYLPLLMVLNKSLNRLMTHYVQLPACREVIGNITCQQFAILLTFKLVLGDDCINRYGYDAVRSIATWLFSSTIFAIYTQSIANGESSVVFSWSWKSDLRCSFSLLSCVLHIIIAKPLIYPHKFPKLKCFRLVLKLSLYSPLEPGVKSRVRMSDQQFYCLLRYPFY